MPVEAWCHISVFVVVSVPLYYLGMQSMGLVGVGLAVSFSALAQVALLFIIWNRRSRNAGSGAVYRFFFKMVLLSVPLWAVLRLLRNLIAAHVAPASTSGCLITAALVGGAFLILLFILGYGLRIREIKRLLERLPGWPAARG